MLMGLKKIPIKESELNLDKLELEKLKKKHAKMSKSNPESAIFMEDSAAEVVRKIGSADCTAQDIKENPILNYVQHIVFGLKEQWTIERPEKCGGNVTFNTYTELESAFADGLLSPEDLKDNLAKLINELLEPVRKHFETDPFAKTLLEKAKEYEKEMNQSK